MTITKTSVCVIVVYYGFQSGDRAGVSPQHVGNAADIQTSMEEKSGLRKQSSSSSALLLLLTIVSSSAARSHLGTSHGATTGNRRQKPVRPTGLSGSCGSSPTLVFD